MRGGRSSPERANNRRLRELTGKSGSWRTPRGSILIAAPLSTGLCGKSLEQVAGFPLLVQSLATPTDLRSGGTRSQPSPQLTPSSSGSSGWLACQLALLPLADFVIWIGKWQYNYLNTNIAGSCDGRRRTALICYQRCANLH